MRSRLSMAPSAALALLFSLTVCTPVRAQLTEPFDHLHIAVADVERARDWYIQHMGGNAGETPDTVAWGNWPVDHPLPIQLHFLLSADARPSAGSTIDHIGFSVADLGARVETLRTAGVKIVSPVTEVPGLGKQAVVEDPWGTKLVLAEDRDAPGSGTCMHSAETARSTKGESRRCGIATLACFFCSLYRMPARDDRND